MPKSNIHIQAYTIPREQRTETPTVPREAHSRQNSLFTRECIHSYTSSWNCIENKYAQYSGSYLKLPRPAQAEGLQEQIYEVDLVDQEESGDSSYAISPLREKGITKQGYLTKAPFHGENDNGHDHHSATKIYKRRWFNLKQISSDGSYVLEYRKDDHATTARGVIYLDSCTHISKGVKGKMYGFELHIHDKTYSLVADSQNDMDQWMACLCRVTGIDIDTCGKSTGISFSVKARLPTKQSQSLRESLKNSKHPLLLEYSKETDVQNAKRRRENRYKLFSLVRDLDSNPCASVDDARVDATVYKENFGTRFVVSCKDLKFRLVNTNSNGEETNIEPFFLRLALFDVKKGMKLSEDFHCDLNDPRVADMLRGSDFIEYGETNGDASSEEKRRRTNKREMEDCHPTNDVCVVTHYLFLCFLFGLMSESLDDDDADDDNDGDDDNDADDDDDDNDADNDNYDDDGDDDDDSGITKQGYLTKAPFHGENDNGHDHHSATKIYKRRWFNLKQISSDGSYVLEYRKDDHATTARGVIYLDSCTHISKGVKGKMYGFELHIHDKTYSLVADSQNDMDQWMACLCRVTGIDIDTCGKSTGISFSVKARLPTKQSQSLRESLKNSKHPLLLEYSKETDVQNAKRRRENRYKLFSLVRDLDSNPCASVDDARVDATVYKENFGTRFVVSCKDLKFRLVNTNSNGEETNIEPFFLRLALFDVKKGMKLSEDFHCDLNDPRVADMLRGSDFIEYGETNGDASSEEKRRRTNKREMEDCHPTNAIFSVTCPHPEVYVVVRIDKVLQGSIGSCVEPYIKSGDIKKTTGKVQKLAEICCRRLGRYTMPFGWAARQVFNNEGSLDENSEFTNIYKQARNIAVTIEFRDIDAQDAIPLKCIYNTDGTPTLTTRATAPVLHHCTYPTFYQEVKIKLPTLLTEKHHVFFTFQHVACDQGKGASGSGSVRGKPIPVESPVGYAWMPILHNGRIRNGELSLLVGQHAPDEYLSAQYAGLQKTTGTDVRWVDREKPLFRINTKLVSTVYTQDPYVYGFFSHCQKFDGSPSSEIEKSNTLKLLNAVDVNTVIQFLPVIFNQLFHVVLVSHSEDVALNVARVLIRITSQVHEAKRIEALKSYVKYVFVTERVENSNKTVHEELAKTLTMNLKPGSDPVVVNDLMRHSWFFFEIIAKSMAQTLVQSDKAKRMNRDNWFPESFHRSLENFVQAFLPQIIKRLKDHAQIAKMREFKFEFLQTVCNHEHYIPLNLPLDVRGLGGVHECELSDDFCKRFFLVGLLLREASSALTQGRHIRKLAIKVLRNLLVKHELDPRYDNEASMTIIALLNEARQSRIAALYLPLLTILLDHVPRFQGSNYELHPSLSQFSHDSTTQAITSEPTSESNRSSAYSQGNLKVSPSDSLTPVAPPPNTPKEGSQMALKIPFEEDETKELLLCFMYILKNLEQGVILDWWRQIMSSAVKRAHWHPTVLYMLHQDKYYSKFAAVIDMFDLLKLALKHFKYQGKASIMKSSDMKNPLPASSTSESTKQYFEQRYKGHSRNPSHGIDLHSRILMEGNLSNEVGLIVLDLIELFCNHFKFHLEQDDGDNLLMTKIFSTLISFLQISQSELMIKHVFASLRSFINKFPVALFRGSANHCGELCREILSCCNSKLESLRTQACAYLYLMMRSNYEFTGGMNCDRIHWQVIVAVSRLMQSGLNRPAVHNSLIALKNFANEDKGMKNTSFPSEVKDITKKIHTVLQATAQMKEHDDIPEVLMDLQFSLAKSYSSTPELREAWLENMANTHEIHKNFSETAHCYIHAAALVAEYLKRQGVYPDGCAAFNKISPNLVPDESMMKTDESMAIEQRFTLKHLVELLEKSALFLERAERYEVMGEVYKLAIPIYEQERDFGGLASAYDNLSKAYRKVVDVMASGKRMLGKYFRVAFFGKVFGDDDGKEYIYKEPKITSLPEISHRLQGMYNTKFHGKIKLIHDSTKVHSDDLDPNFGHIQITYVEPYFDDDEKKTRPTPFEQNNNIRRFMYETPFTASGKAHGSLDEQCKRKTILTTSNTFPYVKKRILVVQEEQYELTPVEVAFDEMQNKVNAGPLAYAQTFLDRTVVHKYPVKHIEKLQQVYKEFIKCCGKALDINHQLIKEDQHLYHDDMKDKYTQMKSELARYIDEEHPPSMRKTGSVSPLGLRS
ncbi:Dedicator of cytokinesis protein 9 [Exaiptasia diaphana]|nr:Dedicator of cytokinesis protein 9 [Exaiptasia diaphana]